MLIDDSNQSKNFDFITFFSFTFSLSRSFSSLSLFLFFRFITCFKIKITFVSAKKSIDSMSSTLIVWREREDEKRREREEPYVIEQCTR